MITDIPLSLYLNQLRYPLLLTDPKGGVFFTNGVFDEFFFRGYTVNDPPTLSDIFSENRILLEALTTALRTQRSHTHRELRIARPGGPEKEMDVEIFPVENTNGKPIAFSISFHDRSERAHIEEHQKWTERIHYLRIISSGLAHEIKNPLSGIKGAAQLLSNALGNKKDLKEYAEIIQKEVVRVDRLLNDLLHFTKMKKPVLKRINLNRTLHELVLLQQTVAGSEIQFCEESDPSLPDIQGDAEPLSQLFLNLIKNARQAIEEKGKVVIRSRIVTDYLVKKGEKRKKMIAVDIEDTGPGIREENLPQIFVPFFTTKSKGTGLGLTLCQKIVEDHEGNLQVRSEGGKGTVFSVYLPA